MRISRLPRFDRRYKKLPTKIKGRAEEREVIFKLNPFNPRTATSYILMSGHTMKFINEFVFLTFMTDRSNLLSLLSLRYL